MSRKKKAKDKEKKKTIKLGKARKKVIMHGAVMTSAKEGGTILSGRKDHIRKKQESPVWTWGQASQFDGTLDWGPLKGQEVCQWGEGMPTCTLGKYSGTKGKKEARAKHPKIKGGYG